MVLTSQQICTELLQLMERLKRDILELAEEHGLTRMQLFALHSIDRQGEVAMGQVADLLGCDASNVTGIVDRLVAHGLVERHEGPHDRRTKKLSLTPKGHELLEAISQLLPERLGCSKLSQAECEALHQIIQKVAT